MSAAVATLIATAVFSLANVFLARGARSKSMREAVHLSIYIGVIFFFLLVVFSGQMRGISWESLFLFAISGVLHFAVGRSAMYEAISVLGASRALVFIALSPVFSLVLAVTLFHEYLAPAAICGALLAISGPVVASRREVSSLVVTTEKSLYYRGVLLALVAAVCWGISPILIKKGLENGTPILLGAFISHATAAVIIIFRDLRDGKLRINTKIINFSYCISAFVVAAVLTNFGQYLLYRALDSGDITTYVVLLQLTPIFTAILTLMVNQHVERVPIKVVVGGLLAVAGSILVVSVR
jgi:drug/metabolite transporter (DMT)-like permease